jgi:hypothetical protein
VLTAIAEPVELKDMSDVELFTALRQHWALPAPAPPDAVRKYSSALSEIWATVRTSEHLTFLDAQMFPEWVSLFATGRPLTPPGPSTEPEPPLRTTVNYWLPPLPEERRAGFYACSQMLQFMEDVYLEFVLDEHHAHIDNRGWMNLFRHWAWSGMLKATWAVTASTYDPRFQRFCRRRLSLEPGFPYIGAQLALPSPEEWRAWRRDGGARCAEQLTSWQDDGGLNFWEAALVDRFLTHARAAGPLVLVPVRVVVESPRPEDGHPFDFNVGYLIADIDWQRNIFTLHHIRIQDHLRNMGIARAALGMVVAKERPRGWAMQLEMAEVGPLVEHSRTGPDDALPSHASAIDVRRIIKSLPRADRSPSPRVAD